MSPASNVPIKSSVAEELQLSATHTLKLDVPVIEFIVTNNDIF